MITFNEKTRIFHLTNQSISYYIYLNQEQRLEKLYFGPYLSEISNADAIRKANVDNNSTQFYDDKDHQEKTFIDQFKSNYALLELSSHGVIDKRGAPIILRYKDGSRITEFLYVEHRINQGILPLKDMPHALDHDDAETLEILLKERNHEVYVKYFLTIYKDKDILVKNFEIMNHEKEEVQIERAFSMQLDLPSMDYRLVHFSGRWAKERDYKVNDIVDGVQEVTSNYGRSSHEENPFVYLMEKNATMNHGEVIGFNMIYSGNFKWRSFTDYFHNLHITYGMNDEDFLCILKPNESFVTPQCVISYSSNGVDKMSQNFHTFIKENLITYPYEKDYKPILFNSWEGCYFDFTTDSIVSYIDDAKKIGSELFVLDDGWFGRRDNDYDGLGDWYVNEKKVDLHRVIEHCHKQNMKFGIWFEPEMVNPLSDYYQNNPHCILKEDNNPLTIARHQFHLDFSNPKVVDDIYEQMVKILDAYEIDYIKWDYNRVVYETYSYAYGKERQGEIYHRLVLGYYSLLSRLIERYPHIMFEGCASGGGRFDLGTLYYCPQIWCSDESDPIQRMFIQYNTSLGYPLSTMGAHANANPITSYQTKAQIALFGTYGYEMNPNRLSEKEMEELSEVAKIYKEYHQSVIENGTLYHISSPNETNFLGLQSVSQDQKSSLFLFMNLLKEGDCYRFVRLQGLDPEAYYWNSYDQQIFKGEYYLKVGINFSRDWFDEFRCLLIELKHVEK
mgnify:FL=1